MNEVLPQLDELLFSSIAGVSVESVEVTDTVVRIEARTTSPRAACPVCGCWSERLHGSYLRFPRDLPAVGRFVVVSLRVRRFVCMEDSCRRKTLVSVRLALAGRAGARMTITFGAPVSRNTLLRLVTSLPEPPAAAPRVVGVDEYAQRRGRIYGTVLVDVETRRPIDLLPDREADTLAAWLAERPGIEIICRDRAPFFAEGATRGAPQALQVADRWHLWHNLGEAAEKCIYQHRDCLRRAPAPPDEPPKETDPTTSSPWQTGHRFAERTRAKHATIHALLDAGHSKRSVARQLGMTLNTVMRLSRATAPEEMFAGQWQSRATSLDAYKTYLDQRWQEGCTNAWKLWEEICEQGYPRGYGSVRDYVSRVLRGKPQPVGPRPPSARAVTRWPLSHPDALTEDDRLHLKAALANCPERATLTEHVRSFAHMVTHLQGDHLKQWIESARATTDLTSLSRFAPHLERDLDAVTADLTQPWNSGVVEEHVNRIKMLKRQMFGRAGFALLRKRVLLS
ncbi:ISL3 family transposase [Streptomyces sp. SID4946]|uniref:ISL3 family transposase n=1 Tax=Streptomyces sp. LamerLS-31b TaxID=1839765 RepID=UPI00081D5123|nr:MULTISPECIES: ISL3 family transposase [unclassified Streptomyces]MYQ95648.1 ISL3 family transposase [Streptomyces sp. SID4946]SCF78149.1 Transposase [Streptomyces sp. LamerLS-31b]SCF96820.1 Transposase [Streptomyces sp. DconLS]